MYDHSFRAGTVMNLAPVWCACRAITYTPARLLPSSSEIRPLDVLRRAAIVLALL